MTLADLFMIGTALAASLLTLISGFGLGTLLLPVFALFFSLELAVGMTAVVHLLNNLFKFGLLWRAVDRQVVARFGIPGVLGAWVGARLLVIVGELPYVYPGILHPVSVLAVIIGLLMIVFALFELVPSLSTWSLPPTYMPAGGLLSGFFGGLSGHQGALRSVFLLRAGLGKETFIATGIAIALLVDLTRIPIYMGQLDPTYWTATWRLLVATTLAAFLGAWLGKRLIPKITLTGVRYTVGGLMLLIALALISGLI